MPGGRWEKGHGSQRLQGGWEEPGGGPGLPGQGSSSETAVHGGEGLVTGAAGAGPVQRGRGVCAAVLARPPDSMVPVP